MTECDLKTSPLAAVQAASGATPRRVTDSDSVGDLLAKLRDKDDKVRAAAWESAGRFGAGAVKPLAELATDRDIEVARAAKRALWKIVRRAGRPGAATEAKAVTVQLIRALSDASAAVRREVLWMLSEIGGDEAVPAVAALLSDGELREDARCTLQRIPGRKATAALRQGLRTVSDDFKAAIAVALRARGETVRGYPSQKLLPTKQTTVRPLAR